MTEDKDPAERFWAFSLATYAGPGVAPACLALQDGLGLDVNLLLYCCWAAAEGHPPLGPERLAAADAAVAPWRAAVVEPLRGIRRDIKEEVCFISDDSRTELRNEIKKLELQSERLVQVALAGLPRPEGDQSGGRAAAERNLADYLSAIGREPGDSDRRHLDKLLGAAFPDRDRD